jgi:hypothetical protein
MVKSGYIPQRLIDHARDMQGTPAYQKYRSDPQFEAVVRLLEGAQGNYNLREATGPVKLQAVEAHRKAYFNKLQRDLMGGFLCLLFLTPVLLLIYYSRPGAGINPQVFADARAAQYIKIAGALHNQLALLTLLPLICYPVGFMVFARSRMDNPA